MFLLRSELGLGDMLEQPVLRELGDLQTPVRHSIDLISLLFSVLTLQHQLLQDHVYH